MFKMFKQPSIITTALVLLSVLTSQPTLTAAFQPIVTATHAKTHCQQLQAKKSSNDNPTTTSKNPMSDSILFGKPQYNWVTGKTEAKMTSSYVHNWNTRRKGTSTLSDDTKTRAEMGEQKDASKARVNEKKPWWQF